MTRIQEIQNEIGTPADDHWGPQSIAACQRYLRSLMPRRNPWPDADQRSLSEFYGEPGDERRLINLSVAGLGVCYEGSPVQTIRVNAACALSLGRVLKAISIGPHAWVLTKYAGCYDNRPMRNGSTPSLHARGAAIDLWPEENGNEQHWPVSAKMPLGVMADFAREGWLSAGAFWGRDGMHAQGTT